MNDTIKEQAAIIKNLNEQLAKADNIVQECLANNYEIAMAYTKLEIRFNNYKRETDMRISDFERRMVHLEQAALDEATRNKTIADKVKRFEPFCSKSTEPE